MRALGPLLSRLRTRRRICPTGDRESYRGPPVPQVRRCEFYNEVALSTADSNKWFLLKEGHMARQSPEVITSSDHQLLGPLRQRQRRLTGAQIVEMAAKYQSGATVYALAAEFGCHRTTVSARLKKAGATLRLQSPKAEDIDVMVKFYESGLSPKEVAEKVGFCANTVRASIKERESNYLTGQNLAKGRLLN